MHIKNGTLLMFTLQALDKKCVLFIIYKIMEAKELMIDDWVYRPDCYDQVKEIRYRGIIGVDSLRGLIGFSMLKPITLTTEILEKNGFERCVSSISRTSTPSIPICESNQFTNKEFH
jgi:hypothetical protein